MPAKRGIHCSHVTFTIISTASESPFSQFCCWEMPHWQCLSYSIPKQCPAPFWPNSAQEHLRFVLFLETCCLILKLCTNIAGIIGYINIPHISPPTCINLFLQQNAFAGTICFRPLRRQRKQQGIPSCDVNTQINVSRIAEIRKFHWNINPAIQIIYQTEN